MLGILGIFLGIACLIVGAFKRVQAMPLTILAAFVVAVTSGINLWQAIGVTYVGGFAGGVQSYLLIFAGTCLYSKFMQSSGCVVKIGYTILDLVGKKNVITACSLVGALLCYGGVSGFVFSFLLVPIMFTLFQEADIPRHLCIGPIMFACGTFVCSSLPGTTQLHNVIPCEFFGIKLTAGWPIGIVMSVLLATMHLIYLNRQVRIAREKGEHFDFPEGTNAADYTVDKSKLPPAWRAFAPLLTLIAIAIIGTNFTTNATMLTVIAVFTGCAVCLALNFEELKKHDLKAMIGDGLSDGVGSIVSLASILGMGAVIQSTEAYQNIVNSLLSLDMNPYVKAVVSTAVISGIVGSGSGGIKVTYNTLGDYFLSQNLNPVYVAKLTSAAAVTIDTLPHAAGPFVHNKLIGLTQRETYRHTFRLTVVHTSIACALLLAYILLFG